MSIPDYMDIFLINSSFKKVYGNPFFRKEQWQRNVSVF